MVGTEDEKLLQKTYFDKSDSGCPETSYVGTMIRFQSFKVISYARPLKSFERRPKARTEKLFAEDHFLDWKT